LLEGLRRLSWGRLLSESVHRLLGSACAVLCWRRRARRSLQILMLCILLLLLLLLLLLGVLLSGRGIGILILTDCHRLGLWQWMVLLVPTEHILHCGRGRAHIFLRRAFLRRRLLI